MSNKNTYRLRRRVLAAATLLILASPLASVHAAERLDLAGLQSADSHDRVIVKYRDGSAAQAQPATVDSARGSIAGRLAGGEARS